MRLTRIDAVRFGALEGQCLEGIGDGLTVVLGPNESGKSTYTALVRAVLFGFPMGRGKAGDRFYRSAAGDRAGRLTFADATGEWAVDRVEGKRGGAVSVSALSGPERPELLSELLGDTNEQTYRVVFGFGVDELEGIENGDDPHLKARLYAAGAGLEKSLFDVREDLTKEAGDLFKPGGSAPVVNRLAGEMRDVREEIRALEAEATAFSDDQQRAERLAAELAPVRSRRDELEGRLRALERDAQKAKDLESAHTSVAARLEELKDASEEQRAVLAGATPDERVLAVAAELDALLGEHSGYERRLEAAEGLRAAADDARRAVAALGPLPDGVSDTPAARERVQAWADRRAQLVGEIRAAERREADAAAMGTAGAGTFAARRPAWAAIGAGVVFGAAGALLGQWLAAVLGAVVAVAGVAWALAGSRSPFAADPEARARASAEAASARAVLDREEAEWSAWVDAQGLGGAGTDPVSVRALLDALRTRTEQVAVIGQRGEDAARERAAADAWARRLAGAAAGFTSADEVPTPDQVPGLVARVREALAAARDAAARREKAAEALRIIEAETVRTAGRREEGLEGLRAIAGAHGAEPADVAAQLEQLASRTAEDLAVVRDETDARAEELATLRGRLDSGGRDAAMAIARQRMEGLRARSGEAADRYLVTTLAVRLLDRARERFERERQPQVTRIAGRVFSEMTGGRYTGIRVPLDGSGIAVSTPSGTLLPTNELSTGTAQQLYLALRVGFLASLGAGKSLPVLMDDVVVNFDAERRTGAAAAIAELAKDRQVVFFTCHEETAEALAAAFPSSARVSLGRCELRG